MSFGNCDSCQSFLGCGKYVNVEEAFTANFDVCSGCWTFFAQLLCVKFIPSYCCGFLIRLGYFWYTNFWEARNLRFIGCHGWLPVSICFIVCLPSCWSAGGGWCISFHREYCVSIYPLIKICVIGSKLFVSVFFDKLVTGRQVQNSFDGLICSAALNYFFKRKRKC